MAVIPSGVEDFGGAAAGVAISSANTVFGAPDGALSGTATCVFAANAYNGAPGARITAVALSKIMRSNFTDRTTLKWGFSLKQLTDTAAPVGLAQWMNVDAKGGDLRLTVDRQIQIRGNTSVQQWLSVALSLNTEYWIYCENVADNPNGHKVKIYQAGVLIDETPAGLVSSSTVPVYNNLRRGIMANSTVDLVVGRFRLDDAVEPATGYEAVTLPNNTTVSPGSTVNVTATTLGAGTLAFSQTGGTAVTLSGTGNTRTFTMPSLPGGSTVTIQATYGGATDTVTYTANPFSAETVSLGPDQNTETGKVVTVTAATTGTASLSFSQTSGPTVTLSGSGNSRTFTMPGSLSSGTPSATAVTIQATYGSATDSVVINAPPHPLWRKKADNSWAVVVRSRKE